MMATLHFRRLDDRHFPAHHHHNLFYPVVSFIPAVVAVLMLTVSAKWRDMNEAMKSVLCWFECDKSQVARLSLCRSRQKAERCSFTARFEGGCYEVSKGVENQI